MNMRKIIEEANNSARAFTIAFLFIVALMSGALFFASIVTGCATITKILTGATNITQNAEAPVSIDAVEFGSLVWDCGGFKPSSSTVVKGNISSVDFNGKMLTYSATVDADWGKEGSGANGTICALFFKDSDGIWRGGKFDWIGFIGKPRPAGHIAEYNGWKHQFPVPKGEEYAYVLIRGDNKRYRTNVAKGVVK